MKGEGDIGPYGGERGDLYITVFIEKDEIFERRNSDIICEVPITITEAILGGEIEVPTLTGKVKMRIPPGTQNGTLFRLKNLGLPKMNGYGKGDQIVKVKVIMPKKLSRQEKVLYQQLKETEKLENYPEVKNFREKYL